MPFVSFQFSAEQLKPQEAQHGVEFWEKNGEHAPKPTDSLLFQGRLGNRIEYVTNARQHGIKWLPEVRHSVVNVFADTWACVCCRIPALGCSRGYNYCGLQLYSISFTRAQWLWGFNLLCFLAHQTMAYLSFTACNGSRVPFTQETINPNCTAEAMSVPLSRLTSRCKSRKDRTHQPRSHLRCAHAAQTFVIITGTNSTGDGYNMGTVSNGGDGVRFDYMTAWFFQLSACAHLFTVLIGPFDRFAFLYWKQLDSAFCPWRWIECEFQSTKHFVLLACILIICLVCFHRRCERPAHGARCP
tara:strand:+ start:3142 stop:4041 length:900 start_codon:yes stop_codon:yes gene_type:complete